MIIMMPDFFFYPEPPSPLIKAIREQKKNDIRDLVTSGSGLTETYQGNTPMYYAIQMTDLETLTLLLQHGDDSFFAISFDGILLLDHFLLESDQRDPNVLVCLDILDRQIKKSGEFNPFQDIQDKIFRHREALKNLKKETEKYISKVLHTHTDIPTDVIKMMVEYEDGLNSFGFFNGHKTNALSDKLKEDEFLQEIIREKSCCVIL